MVSTRIDTAKLKLAAEQASKKIVELNQRITDSQLVWRGEAWTPALMAYGVAKVLSKTTAALRSVVDPLAAIFATYRARAPKPQDPTEKK